MGIILKHKEDPWIIYSKRDKNYLVKTYFVSFKNIQGFVDLVPPTVAVVPETWRRVVEGVHFSLHLVVQDNGTLLLGVS